MSEVREKGMAMATDSSAPYPYDKPLLARLEPTIGEYGDVTWQTYGHHGSLPPITGPTDFAWKQLEIILTGIETLAERKQYFGSDEFGLPARIELFWDHDHSKHRLRGLAIFDTQARLIVHVTNALLGYGGAGPYLTEQILRFIGVPEVLIEELQRATREKAYYVILSRQKHGVYEGVDTTIPTLEVKPTWRWWFANLHLRELSAAR